MFGPEGEMGGGGLGLIRVCVVCARRSIYSEYWEGGAGMG